MDIDVIERGARRAFDRLVAAHELQPDLLSDLMWMGEDDGLDRFKHRITRKSFDFDPQTGAIAGRLDTGEESDDAAAVLREVETL